MKDEGVDFYERTYRLKSKDGRYAWIYDDNGEIFKDKLFDSREEAEDWWNREYGSQTLKITYPDGRTD